MIFKELIDELVPADDSASEAERMLLYWLIRNLEPNVVIETGTHRGLTALYMAHALYDNEKGFLTTCDPGDWGSQSNINKFPQFASYIQYLKIRGDQMTVNNIDFAFIDGFHGKQDVLEELEMLLPKLSKSCVVLFHDCWYGNTPGVNEALEEAGLHTMWLPTENAIRVYARFPDKPTSPADL